MTTQTVADYSDEELLDKFEKIHPMKGIGLVDLMLDELQKEIMKRGL